MVKTVPRAVSVRMVQTVTTSLGSVPAAEASWDDTVNKVSEQGPGITCSVE